MALSGLGEPRPLGWGGRQNGGINPFNQNRDKSAF